MIYEGIEYRGGLWDIDAEIDTGDPETGYHVSAPRIKTIWLNGEPWWEDDEPNNPMTDFTAEQIGDCLMSQIEAENKMKWKNAAYRRGLCIRTEEVI